MSDWLRHDGGPNPAPGKAVDLIWGIGVIERQPSNRVNWSFKWQWRLSADDRERSDTDRLPGVQPSPGKPSNPVDEHPTKGEERT